MKHLFLGSHITFLAVTLAAMHTAAWADIESPYLGSAPRLWHKAEKLAGRAEWWQLRHRDEFGNIPEDGNWRGLQARDEMLRKQFARGAFKAAGIGPDRWTAISTGAEAGRIRAIVAHPTDGNRLWIGAATGGVWRSTNGGTSWQPLSDTLGSLAVAALALEPGNPNILYAGTGEWATGYRGAGIFRSGDGGLTWQFLPATDPAQNSSWRFVMRIVVHPTQPNIVIAGTWGGIFRSLDRGQTWSQVFRATSQPSFNNNAHDIEFDPSNANRLVAGLAGGSVAISQNAGASWQLVQIADIVPDDDVSARVEIAHAASRPGLIYASVNRNQGEIFRSENGGMSWTFLSSLRHLGQQGNYNNTLWVDPTQHDLLIGGGVGLRRSRDGGVTWEPFENPQPGSGDTYNVLGTTKVAIHPDHHWVATSHNFDGAANRRVYLGTDGGLFTIANVAVAMPTDGQFQGDGWLRLNSSLRITQHYTILASDSANPYVLGGTQDNGIVYHPLPSENTETIINGDGMSLSRFRGSTFTYFALQRLFVGRAFELGRPGTSVTSICRNLPDSGKTPQGTCTTSGGNANFQAPILLDPNNASRLLAGGNSLWLSTDPESINPNWAEIKSPSSSLSGRNYISTMTVAQGDSALIYVGHNNGELYKTTNGTGASPSWTLQSGIPQRLVTDILIDPADHNRVYVTLGGFTANNLWVTTNGGANWFSLGASLPAVPFHAITRHPQRASWLYLGTEVGLFVSQDSGSTWYAFNDGPNNAVVTSLDWDGNQLFAGTFGRGIYRATPSLDDIILTVYEFYNTNLNHYFRTASEAEAQGIDVGAAGPGWIRTGDNFRAWAHYAHPASAHQVCRFYGSVIPGPNSHFYTAAPTECEFLKRLQLLTPTGEPRWNYEGIAFAILLPLTGGCPSGHQPIYRLYNNRAAQVDSNHRFTTQLAVRQEMVARGWVDEGAVMCAPL